VYNNTILSDREKTKIVNDIMDMQTKLWIPMHRESKEELISMDDNTLFRYYQAHNILYIEQK